MGNFAIVGAGLAGMSLAYLLKKTGHYCSVFEKAQQYGGRLTTQVFADWQVDHGTQYFTARTPAFDAEVKSWVEKGWVAPWRAQTWKVTRDEITASADERQRYIGQPTMNAMFGGLAEGIQVYLQTRIDRLEKVAQHWRVWDEHGEHYGNFDAVLITAPMPQALALLPSRSALEQKLKSSQMTPTWAYGVSFQQPTGIKADALFISDDILTWAAKDSSKPGRSGNYETWIAHFSAGWSANHLEASEDLLHNQVYRFLGRLTDKPLPKVHQAFKYRWLYARSNTPVQDIPLWDSDQKLGLAGDWTIGSRLEDAWTSAALLAEQLTNDFK